MRWLARLTTAIARSLFVANSRNRYACEMPAFLAISAVGLAWIPREAMTGIAAAMTASRRSSAVESVRVAVGAIGVSMHSLTPAVKSRSESLTHRDSPLCVRDSDFAHNSAGVADRDDSGWDVLRDDAARPD